MQKEKDKIDNSILDEEDNALAAILSQLTTLSNRIAVIEIKDSPREADILVSREATPRVSSQCKKRTASSVDFSDDSHSNQSTEENPSRSLSVDNQSSIPNKRVRVELSDDGEYDSLQEKQPIPTYSDTLFTIKNGLTLISLRQILSLLLQCFPKLLNRRNLQRSRWLCLLLRIWSVC